MTYNKYHGWVNRETWLVNIHFNDLCGIGDKYIYHSIEDLKDSIEEMVYSMGLSTYLLDMINLSCIDWEDLGKYMFEKT
jgi:hypothetical protein